jgi:hypothetical protein
MFKIHHRAAVEQKTYSLSNNSDFKGKVYAGK